MAVSVFCVQVFLYCMFSFSFPKSFPENSRTNGSKVKSIICTTGALIMKDPYHTSIQISPCAYFVSATLFMHMLISCVALLVIHSCCIYTPIALQLLWAAMSVLLRSVALRHSKNFHTNMHESNIRHNTIKSCRLLHVKR